MKSKTPSQSRSTQTEIVLPNDTNNLKNLMGGRLLHWMDIATAIAAHRHCEKTVESGDHNQQEDQPHHTRMVVKGTFHRVISLAMISG